MGWFGRKRDPQDASEVLRRYNEAEAARLAGIMAGGGSAAAPGTDAAPATVMASTSAATFDVEDVFRITGRGLVATGSVTSGRIRVGDQITVVRAGAPIGETEIAGIEMFRKRVTEATAGILAGVVLRDAVDIVRGDVIRVTASA